MKNIFYFIAVFFTLLQISLFHYAKAQCVYSGTIQFGVNKSVDSMFGAFSCNPGNGVCSLSPPVGVTFTTTPNLPATLTFDNSGGTITCTGGGNIVWQGTVSLLFTVTSVSPASGGGCIATGGDVITGITENTCTLICDSTTFTITMPNGTIAVSQ